MHEPRPLAVLIGKRVEHAINVPGCAGAALNGEAERLAEDEQIAVLEQGHIAERRRIRGRGRAPHCGRRRRLQRLQG